MKKSFITNIAFPKSLDELLHFMEGRGKRFRQSEGDSFQTAAKEERNTNGTGFRLGQPG